MKSELAPLSSASPRPAYQLAIRIFIGLLCLVGAFHYSLFTLFRGLSLDSPLAYLGLVPAIAAVLAVMLSRPSRTEPDVHDRYVDYIVGIPLVIISLAVMIIVSARLSTFFWLWRVDLLTLPLFAAGATSLIFGFRALWRIRFAIGFLWLAWPPPYTLLLDGWLETSTAATLSALGSVVQVIPVAQQLQAGDGSLFSVTHGAESFILSVASACAGANSSLGFALVGLAFVGIAGGGLIQKALWLMAGTILIWSLNLLRILVIFTAGRVWGETVAIDTLHPFLGLVGFTLGLLVMVAASPIFGVRLPESEPRERLGRSEPNQSHRGSAPTRVRSRGVQRAAVPMAIVLGAALITGIVDAQMRSFELLAHDLGPPRIEASNIATAQVGGWLGRQTGTYPFVRQYFGKDASWDRYSFGRTQAGLIPANAAFVTLDVISTSDLSSFSTYGLEACYGFHRYQILEAQRVELAGGVVGRSVVYENPKTRTRWSAVYWEWPVLVAGAQRYERVVLYLMQAPADASTIASTRGGLVSRIQLALADALGGSVTGLAEPELGKTRDFLIAFASDLITATGAQKARAHDASSP